MFFLSDSTGISAETMGNALLIQFPDLIFERKLIPFISSVEEAWEVVAVLDAAMDGPVTALVFTTAAVDEIRAELHKSRCPIMDFFDMHMFRVEKTLLDQEIDTMSLNPDTVIDTWLQLAQHHTNHTPPTKNPEDSNELPA